MLFFMTAAETVLLFLFGELVVKLFFFMPKA